MAFKYTCILLLVSLVFLLAQAKHVKKGNTKQKDEVLPKVHDTIKFKGRNYDCDYFHTTNNFGTWCGCPFLACTGGQDCHGTYHCFIKNKNYDYRDMKDEDCDCHDHRK